MIVDLLRNDLVRKTLQVSLAKCSAVLPNPTGQRRHIDGLRSGWSLPNYGMHPVAGLNS